MSLSEDERRELERLRKHYKRSRAHENFAQALMIGAGLAFLASRVISYLTPVERNLEIFIIFVCFATGIFLRYGLKEKKEAEG